VFHEVELGLLQVCSQHVDFAYFRAHSAVLQTLPAVYSEINLLGFGEMLQATAVLSPSLVQFGSQPVVAGGCLLRVLPQFGQKRKGLLQHPLCILPGQTLDERVSSQIHDFKV
jgi:hypothetical protein